jgi:mono/diheme cytochrome c family protein
MPHLVPRPVVALLACFAAATAGAKQLEWKVSEPQMGGGHEDPYADITYTLTNRSDREVTVKAILPSCGCTGLRTPSFPWVVAPGASGTIEARVDLRGKVGELHKRITVYTTDNMIVMPMVVRIPEIPLSDERMRNQQLALADARAIFRGECAKCHVEPAVGKKGGELYQAACAICHEAHPRASSVPELAPNTREHFRRWITEGRKGTLMPPFAQENGGILTREEIDSLVDYLAKRQW